MDRRFHCTACGKCCYGTLPLTLSDALLHAHRFPLAFVWNAVPQGARAFALATQLGTLVRLPKRGKVAVLVAPVAYLPPALPCPELTPEGRCGIHATKPARCRTMPFFPYREERDQGDLLRPRNGWACDTSEAAPVVYRGNVIVDRGDFDDERTALRAQVPVMRTYAAYALTYLPWVIDHLNVAAGDPNGRVVTSLSSFLTATRTHDPTELAKQQLPVLADLLDRTAGSPDLASYHQHYSGWLKEMQYLAFR
jgi:Fe-S-cluster containining protein